MRERLAGVERSRLAEVGAWCRPGVDGCRLARVKGARLTGVHGRRLTGVVRERLAEVGAWCRRGVDGCRQAGVVCRRSAGVGA